jgi:undecaprenyl diphosphate synthase
MVPKHVAIIPDGNRRWAKAHGLKPWQGHEKGLSNFWEVSETFFGEGVLQVTSWGLSLENLIKRTKLEVKFLLVLIRNELEKPEFLKKLYDNKINFKVVGEWNTIVHDTSLQNAIKKLENETAHFKKRKATILLGYDGKSEMLSAIKGFKNDTAVTEKNLRQYLWTGDLEPVDLLIRTGGEPHNSAGFMMWQTADSQYYFTDILWPDFNSKQARLALNDYDKRQRRFGK